MGVNSELRLQCLLAKFKPAGIFAKVAYFGISDGMNVITEGEDHSSYAYFSTTYLLRNEKSELVQKTAISICCISDNTLSR
ncbi:hypothetical protein L596_025415 [Steinernema carpocapsae]|uniref:Uncharacterized protein n=1 Tax=Steinernema carpocapsae TaxID=34508 RepID=A0A4U5M7Q5_STECR|nr:hypothetical protein L596_025415 [Steinernema carpocapsae]